MKNKKTEKNINKKNKKLKTAKVALLILIVPVVIAGILGFKQLKSIGTSSYSDVEQYTVKRGNLKVCVVENGSIKPVKSVMIKTPRLNDYYTNIVSIVPEGTFISPEDVNEMVLVELDSSKMVEQLPQLEIDVTNAESSFAEAKENYDIRVKQNESDITSAKMKVKFAKMDIQKYLGHEASEEVLESVSLDANSPQLNMESLIQKISDSNSLCEASQKMLELTSSIKLAEEDLEKSKFNLGGKQKLFDSNYASENELNESRLQVERQKINKSKVEISLALFKSFEFPKQVEQLISNYMEAELTLEQTQSKARSQLKQEDARLRNAESSLKTRKERLETFKEQIESCTIKAPSPGQVVYYSSMERYTSYQIEQGAEIPRGYTIIAIPDTTQLKVEIKVPETWINKIQIGQEAKITTTAFPDKVFYGKLLKKAPMADSQSSSLQADVKVYTTDVSIEGYHEFLKTGMTAKAEILIEELKNVLFIPIQSVVSDENNKEKVCYVVTDKGVEKRTIEIGLFNDNFVEVKSGLEEGERVLYNPPRWNVTEPTEPNVTEDNSMQEKNDPNSITEHVKQSDSNKPAEPASVQKQEVEALIQNAIKEQIP